MSRHWRFVVPAALLIVVLVALVVSLSNNLVFFNTPTELIEQSGSSAGRIRLGGQVVFGSVVAHSDSVRFQVTDGRHAVEVLHRGAPQALFQEGRGVVLEGDWDGTVFLSDTMLVKHDEQYRTEDGSIYDPGDPSSVGS